MEFNFLLMALVATEVLKSCLGFQMHFHVIQRPPLRVPAFSSSLWVQVCLATQRARLS